MTHVSSRPVSPPADTTPVQAPAAAPGTPAPTPWRRTLQLAALLTVVVAVLVTAFAWSATSAAPRAVPIGLVGPEAATTQIAQALEQSAPGAFDLTGYTDADAARTAIHDRDVYGAVVVDSSGTTVLTATAASPVVAGLLDEVAASLSDQMLLASGAEPAPALVAVDDVVSISAEDSRGAAFTSSILPLSLGGIALGAASVLLVTGLRRKATFLAAASVGAGLAVALITGPWLGVLPGSFWAVAGVAALGLGAVGTAIAGMAALIGLPGISIVAALTMVLGNPLSGASSAPQMLPEGWSTLGQLLPPGAAATALRSVVYFDGAGAATAIAVLACWVVLGAALLVVGLRRRARATTGAAVTAG